MTMTGPTTSCRSCSAHLPVGTRFCVSCGAAAAPSLPSVNVPSLTANSPADHDIQLVRGETERYRTTFSPHVLLSHLKVTSVLTDRRFIVRRPHTIFGVVPHGFVEHSSPVSSLVEVTAIDTWSTKRLLAAAACLPMAVVSALHSGGIGILLLFVLIGVGAYLFASARTMGLVVRNTGGGRLVAPAGRREIALVLDAAAKLNAAINPPL